MATNQTGITAEHADYQRYTPIYKKIRAILEGKDAVVELKLPMPNYTDMAKGGLALDTCKIANRNKIYLQRGQLLNATARTQQANTGMIWSQEPEGLDSIPSQMEYVHKYLRDNVQKIVADVASVGRYGVLIDSPSITSTTKGEQARGIGVTNWILYTTEQIFFWHGDDIRLSETYEEIDGIDYKQKEQVRRLVMIDGVYHNQVWRDNALVQGMDLTPTIKGVTLDYIPFQYFGSDNNLEDATKPPIYDMTEQNLGHFMLDCDNRDNLHAHGQGMLNLFIEDTASFLDVNPNGTNTGAKGENQFGKDDRVEILQIAATGAIAAEMERDQERLVMMGAQMVQDSSGNQTLGAKKIEAGASISTLKQISMNVSEGVTQLLRWQAGMMGIANVDSIYYTLNTAFITDDMTPEKLLAHMKMVQMRVLPLSTLNESARQAGLTKLDDEALKKELNDESFSVGGTTEEEAKTIAANEE